MILTRFEVALRVVKSLSGIFHVKLISLANEEDSSQQSDSYTNTNENPGEDVHQQERSHKLRLQLLQFILILQCWARFELEK